MFLSLTPFVPWLNLTHKLSRLVLLLSGIVFAVVLMFMFTGFQNALFDSQIEIIQYFKGDVFVLSKQRTSIALSQFLDRRIINQVQAYEGVASAHPMYLGELFWKNAETQKVRLVRVIGFNLNDPLLTFPELDQDLGALTLPNTVWVDRLARPEIGPKTPGTVTELGNVTVRVVGNFSLGNDFASLNGNLITSDRNFLRYFTSSDPTILSRSLEEVDLIVVKSKPDYSPEQIAQRLRADLPQNVQVYTKPELEEFERNYWIENSLITFVFGVLTVMAFVIGIILCYQIIYADINDHITAYATLKAIGYRDRFLFLIIFQEALLLGTMGFIPGALLSYGLYFLSELSTGLVFKITFFRSLELFSWTIIMCFVSGVLSLFKIQKSEPADIF